MPNLSLNSSVEEEKPTTFDDENQSHYDEFLHPNSEYISLKGNHSIIDKTQFFIKSIDYLPLSFHPSISDIVYMKLNSEHNFSRGKVIAVNEANCYSIELEGGLIQQNVDLSHLYEINQDDNENQIENNEHEFSSAYKRQTQFLSSAYAGEIPKGLPIWDSSKSESKSNNIKEYKFDELVDKLSYNDNNAEKEIKSSSPIEIPDTLLMSSADAKKEFIVISNQKSISNNTNFKDDDKLYKSDNKLDNK